MRGRRPLRFGSRSRVPAETQLTGMPTGFPDPRTDQTPARLPILFAFLLRSQRSLFVSLWRLTVPANRARQPLVRIKRLERYSYFLASNCQATHILCLALPNDGASHQRIRLALKTRVLAIPGSARWKRKYAFCGSVTVFSLPFG